MLTTKQCTKCNIIKPISEFNKDKQKKDGIYTSCKICKKKYDLAYRKSNIVKIREYDKERNIRDNEKRKNLKRKVYAKRREYYKMLSSEYAKSEAGKISKTNAENKRRYIKKSTTDCSIPINMKYPLTKSLQCLLELQNNKCYMCGCELTEKHLDHHIPLAKGGTHSIDNVVWLCPACNRTKSDSMPTTLLLV